MLDSIDDQNVLYKAHVRSTNSLQIFNNFFDVLELMKTSVLATSIVAMLLVTLITSSAYAQQTETSLPDPGILPDNQFYGLKRAFETIWIILTFGDDAKALKALDLAQTRLAEADAMANAGKPQFLDAVLDQYSAELENADRLVASLPQDKKPEIAEKIATATSRHITVLDDIVEKVPEQTKEVVIAARDISIKGNMKALKDLAVENPRKAAEIATDVAHSRAEVASDSIRDGHQKEAVKATQHAKAYEDLANEIRTTSNQAEKHDSEGKQKGNNSTKTH